VVRRPGHDGVLGRHLAQRGVRELDGRKIVARFDPSCTRTRASSPPATTALENDSLVAARQIRQPILAQDDIFTAFDSDHVRQGRQHPQHVRELPRRRDVPARVRDSLASHAYGNATSTDFVGAISKAAGKDVSAAFATFLEQAGTPELTATLTCEAARPRSRSPSKRLPAAGLGRAAGDQAVILPVCVAYDSGGKRAEACTQLDAATGVLALDAKACPRWVMPNVNGRGYYRNRYSAGQLTALRDEAWPQLAWTERRAILFDVGDAASTGRLPLPLALSLVPKMLAGGDRFSIGPAIGLVDKLARMVPVELQPSTRRGCARTFGPARSRRGSCRATPIRSISRSRANALIRAVHGAAASPSWSRGGQARRQWRDLPQSSRAEVLAGRGRRAARAVRPGREGGRGRGRSQQAPGHAARAGERARSAAPGHRARPHARSQARIRARPLAMLVGGRGDRGSILGDGRDANAHRRADLLPRHQEEIRSRCRRTDLGPVRAAQRPVHRGCRAEQRETVTSYVMHAFAVLPGGKRTVAQNLEQMEQCIARRAVLEPEIAPG